MPTTRQWQLTLLKAATADIRERYRAWIESETATPVVFLIDWHDTVGRKFAEALSPPEQLSNARVERAGGVRAESVGVLLRTMSAQEADRLFAQIGVTVDHQAQAEPGYVIVNVAAYGDVFAYHVALTDKPHRH